MRARSGRLPAPDARGAELDVNALRSRRLPAETRGDSRRPLAARPFMLALPCRPWSPSVFACPFANGAPSPSGAGRRSAHDVDGRRARRGVAHFAWVHGPLRGRSAMECRRQQCGKVASSRGAHGRARLCSCGASPRWLPLAHAAWLAGHLPRHRSRQFAGRAMILAAAVHRIARSACCSRRTRQ